MSNVPATQQRPQGVLIQDPEQLQKWMMGLVENPKFAQRYEGIIDRNAMFLAVSYCRANPYMLSQIKDPASIVNAVIQAGAYGWTCDGITGHAYIVPFGGKAVLMPGYKGLLDLVRRSGKCEASIEAVHAGDQFEYRGRFREPLHVRSDDPNRRSRQVTHAYVVAAFTSGIVECFVWSREECLAHRDRYSQGWKRVAGKPEKEADSPWSEKNPGFWVMCCKTVLRNCINRGELPISLKDNAGRQTLETLHDDETGPDSATVDTPPLLTFDTHAGYVENLSPGDDIAADAAKEIQEQTIPPTPRPDADPDPRQDALTRLRACRTVSEIDLCVSDALETSGVDIRTEGEEKKAAMKTRERGAKPAQRSLPGEA